MQFSPCFTLALSLLATAALAAPPVLDERPAGEEEWGYRPAEGSLSETTPPSFSWRPQRGIARWELECQSVLEAEVTDGRIVALLPTDDSATLTAGELETTGRLLIRRLATDGSAVETITSPALP